MPGNSPAHASPVGARTAQAAGISRPIGPHALRRTVGRVGLNQGIPLRDIQRLLRHARPETTLASYDISCDALERHASHQVAGFLAGWAGKLAERAPRCLRAASGTGDCTAAVATNADQGSA